MFDRVVDNYILTETAVAMIMYQICEAIRYIHSQKIIHLDLKVRSFCGLILLMFLFLAREYHVRLIDWQSN